MFLYQLSNIQVVSAGWSCLFFIVNDSMSTFSIFQLYDKIRRSEQKYKVALEVLSYHSQASEDEVDKTKEIAIPDALPDLIK